MNFPFLRTLPRSLQLQQVKVIGNLKSNWASPMVKRKKKEQGMKSDVENRQHGWVTEQAKLNTKSHSLPLFLQYELNTITKQCIMIGLYCLWEEVI